MFQPALSISPSAATSAPYPSDFGDEAIYRFPDSRSGLKDGLIAGVGRRFGRERRRRAVGRAYDMALEVARVIPRESRILDVGCGNGFIAHHLSAMLGSRVIGIDLNDFAQAPIDYRKFDGATFPVNDQSVDVILLCYVLHHAQNINKVLSEMRRVVRHGGVAIVYEDIPALWWDRFVCWTHHLKWRGRTGPCVFRGQRQWKSLFEGAGFEVVAERELSRWRNVAHPVSRGFFLLKRNTAGEE